MNPIARPRLLFGNDGSDMDRPPVKSNIIRTGSSQWEIGSDYLFSLADRSGGVSLPYADTSGIGAAAIRQYIIQPLPGRVRLPGRLGRYLAGF